MRLIVSLITGLVFGFGLILSQMVNPAVVRGFLDFAGNWNPALAFVLGGAVLTSILAWKIRAGRQAPILGGDFPLDASSHIDRKLVTGSVIFGIGWGLVGICPGPAIVGIGFGVKNIWIFVGSMLLGMIFHQWMTRKT